MQSLRLVPLTRQHSRANIAEVAHAIARKILSRNPKPNAFSRLPSISTQKLEDVKGQKSNSVISKMRKFSEHQRHSVPAKCLHINSLKQLRLQITEHQKSKNSMSSSCRRVENVRVCPWNLNFRPSARHRPTPLERKRCQISARHKRA